MASKITYDDKISLTTSALPRANKCTDDDLNEIKEVVNENADELMGLQGKVLFSSTTGENGQIVLNDNINNYKFLDILYCGNNGSTDVTRIYDFNKQVNLSTSNCNQNGTTVWIQTETISISNNEIIRGTQTEVTLQQNVPIAPYLTSIYILKVIGYK